MENRELISVIVPAYNAERTINRCIDSILSQTYENIEIIIINDGSKDETENKCKKYLQNEKIRYINIKNSGVSNARNIGIEKATGKYIIFVDSDDYLENIMIEELYKNVKDGIDLVICGKNLVKTEGIIKENIDIDNNIFTKEDFIKIYKSKILNPPYCKLYKAEIINKYNIKFDKTISIGEDLLFNILYLKNIGKNVIVIKENLYNYEKISSNSLSTKYYSNMLEMKEKIVKELRKCNVQTEQEERELQIIIFDLLFSAISNELKNKDNNFLKRYINGYNIIHTKEFKNQIDIMLERKIMTKVDYKILKSYFYIIFVIFIRKKYRVIF